MKCYRILHKKYGDPLFAPGLAGRWNSAGKKVIYCAESIPLAFMESMIRRKGMGFNNDFHTVEFEIIDPNAQLISLSDLPKGWNAPFDYEICQHYGDRWYDKQESLILQVPSAVMPTNYNFIINATHRDFVKVKLLQILPLIPDTRIEEILRNTR